MTFLILMLFNDIAITEYTILALNGMRFHE